MTLDIELKDDCSTSRQNSLAGGAVIGSFYFGFTILLPKILFWS